ncbi:MAG: twin-arginine translocase TatA/TatE family subunit [Magnetococcus sp. MYC-9]
MGWAELLVIAIVALLAVGPEKLPEVAQGLARMIRQARRVVSELREAINLEEFDTQLRRNSQAGEPFPGVDRDLRTHRVVEREALDLGGGGGGHLAATPDPATPFPPPAVEEGREPASPSVVTAKSLQEGVTTTTEHAR